MSDNNESHLIYEIMRELGRHGAVYRTNAGCVRLPNGRTYHGLPKGFSDILFIGPDGIACFVEAKVRPNGPTPEQIAFLDKMHGLGCRAGVAYSVAEAAIICRIEQ